MLTVPRQLKSDRPDLRLFKDCFAGGLVNKPDVTSGPVIPSMLNAQKLALTLVPAAQQAGAIKVSGGTQDGIYTQRGTAGGKTSFNVLGQLSDNENLAIYWESSNLSDAYGITPTAPGFVVVGEVSTPLYYSLSDVATPDLATDWKNASDDSPASITVALATSSDMIDYGQSAKVTDGFVVSDAGDPAAIGFYADNGSVLNGHAIYERRRDAIIDQWQFGVAGSYWSLFLDINNDNAEAVDGNENVAHPWETATWQSGTPTVTHPAIQTLQPPSDSFVVSGSTPMDGLYTQRGIANGKSFYNLQGSPDNGVGGDNGVIWSGGWFIIDATETVIFSSSENVSEPYLVSAWSDDNASGVLPTLTPSPSADPTVVVVSGAGTAEANGVYQWSKSLQAYKLLGADPSDYSSAIQQLGSYWVLWPSTGDGGDFLYANGDDLSSPWLGAFVGDALGGVGADPAPTVTAQIQHPALFVSGAGTAEANGIYTERGVGNGRPYYTLLGTNYSDGVSELFWDGSTWILSNSANTVLYFSSDDVQFPWLITSWTVAVDGTAPAPTLTPITAAELAAGLRVSNDGATNGASYVSQPFRGRQYYMGLNGGGSNNLHWDTDYNVWTDDVGEWTSDNVAFPWQGTDAHAAHNGASFARNDVAAEVSWSNA